VKRETSGQHSPTDPYFKKVITLKQSGFKLDFRVSQNLFSSFDIDLGTKFLLRTLASADLGNVRSILDLGCGYGPLGVTLAKMLNPAAVHMVDRDALAVQYSRQNAALNGLGGIHIYGSLGYDAVAKHDFDLVVSNIPAKAGDAAIASFLRDAVRYLAPSGSVAVVVVTPLEPSVARLLATTPGVVLLDHKTRPGHAVFHYRFVETSDVVATTDHGSERTLYRVVATTDHGSERTLYRRDTVTFRHASQTFTLDTAYGLAEFDTPSYDTQLLLEGLPNTPRTTARHVIVLHPRQGFSALAAHASFRPDAISLVDRDLLALAFTQHNLVRNGYDAARITTLHDIGLPPDHLRPADVIVATLRDDEGPEVVTWLADQAAQVLHPNRMLYLVGTSTAISRLSGAASFKKHFTVEDRNRRAGYSLLVAKRTH
jgi:16S rRNA G1207 methylase RsmC